MRALSRRRIPQLHAQHGQRILQRFARKAPPPQHGRHRFIERYGVPVGHVPAALLPDAFAPFFLRRKNGLDPRRFFLVEPEDIFALFLAFERFQHIAQPQRAQERFHVLLLVLFEVLRKALLVFLPMVFPDQVREKCAFFVFRHLHPTSIFSVPQVPCFYKQKTPKCRPSLWESALRSFAFGTGDAYFSSSGIYHRPLLFSSMYFLNSSEW